MLDAFEAGGVSEADLVRGVRGRRNVARLVAVSLCRELTAATATEIGRAFGVARTSVPALASRGAGAELEETDARSLARGGRRRLGTKTRHASS